MREKKLTTEMWAKSHGESTEATPPPVENYTTPFARSAHSVAVRALILQGVVAVASEVDPEPILDWFRGKGIWAHVTPREKQFLLSTSPTEEARSEFHWHCEAEWTLLWVIGKVETLGLPNRVCDTRRLVDEIIPALGDDIQEFVASSKLRPASVVLAEDLRTYNLWCYANVARIQREPLPSDLNWGVLYERRYAFEWLQGDEEWDEVQCDS